MSSFRPSFGASYPPSFPASGESGLFIPNLLPNLAVWMDAADPSTFTFATGTALSAWANKGNVAGVGDAIQATVAQQPRLVTLDNMPAVEGNWDGVNPSSMEIADSVGLNYTRYTYIAAVRLKASTGDVQTIAGKLNTTGSQRETRLSLGSTERIRAGHSVDGATENTAVAPNDATGILAANVEAVLSDWYDGTNVTARYETAGGQGTTALAAPFNGTSPFYLFSRNLGSDRFNGYIRELCFFTRELSIAERLAVVAYLNTKWNVL